MDATTQDPIDTAAAWHAQIDSPDMDWAGFGDWLAADPSHRTAYDSIALLDAEIGAAAPAIAALLPANDDGVADAEPVAVTRPTRWRWMAAGTGGALAAGLALLLVAPAVTTGDSGVQIYATGPGETRAVTLADGSAMQLDRGSRVSVSGGRTPLSPGVTAGATSSNARPAASAPPVPAAIHRHLVGRAATAGWASATPSSSSFAGSNAAIAGAAAPISASSSAIES